MPYIQDKDLKDLQDRLKKLEDQLRSYEPFLKHCKGQPTIQGYQGKRLDLNDNLNVIELFKKLNNKQDKSTINSAKILASDYIILEEDVDKVLVFNSVSPVSVTLPTADQTGNIYKLANVGAGVVTVSNPLSTINGEASQFLNQYDVLVFYDYSLRRWIAGL